MTQINAYLTFNGNCKQAFEFYKQVFQIEFTTLETFGSAPDGIDVDDRDRIMHVSMTFDTGVLMASDTPQDDPNFSTGNNFSLCLETRDKAQTDEWINALAADGGMVTLSPSDTFWGAYFGMCKDQFGINWMLMCGHK